MRLELPTPKPRDRALSSTLTSLSVLSCSVLPTGTLGTSSIVLEGLQGEGGVGWEEGGGGQAWDPMVSGHIRQGSIWPWSECGFAVFLSPQVVFLVGASDPPKLPTVCVQCPRLVVAAQASLAGPGTASRAFAPLPQAAL